MNSLSGVGMRHGECVLIAAEAPPASTPLFFSPSSVVRGDRPQRSITVTFTDEGASPTGNVQLRSQYACVGNCPQPNPVPDSVSCATQLSFWARRIDTSRIEAYQPAGN